MTVITMTREMGSLGNRVAQEVSKRLGLRLLYQEIVQSVSERLGANPSDVGRFVESGPDFLDRFTLDARHLGLCTTEELFTLALQGNVLLRGWGGAFVLKPVAHVMHVRVCAPIALRVERVLKRIDSLDARASRHEIEESDRRHSTVIERIYGQNGWQDPRHYHLVLDTGVTSVEECVERIVAMAKEPRFQPQEASRRALEDCLMAARIRSLLRATPDSRGVRIEVAANDGAVSLEGIVEDDRQLDAVRRAASAFPGVVSVHDRLRVMREASNYMSE